ncbi:hypothetical protein K435DRAFT_805863 [Dendrothele bispora CBS 962.96]|uniref:Uncharacterized protein n=1 Tax=Dendrothele bispora (strain CBS 962.96) TaxID=1314807 RepID=A0A4S8L9J6_DENBC|nr:hypothetical protein K435DRAFT_805863 [Dendrothele bispora CBS 962.96]
MRRNASTNETRRVLRPPYLFESLRKSLTLFPNFEAVEIQDVPRLNFSDASKDQLLTNTKSFMFQASKLSSIPTRLDINMKSVVDCCLNVVRQAYKVGIKKAATHPDEFYLSQCFLLVVLMVSMNSVTEEQVATGNPWFLYSDQKKFGDQAVIEYAKPHPEIDVKIFEDKITIGFSWIRMVEVVHVIETGSKQVYVGVGAKTAGNAANQSQKVRDFTANCQYFKGSGQKGSDAFERVHKFLTFSERWTGLKVRSKKFVDFEPDFQSSSEKFGPNLSSERDFSNTMPETA